ncbi:hypothetical protein [Microscilla marina]|uniref:Uncharacterized protein n=1 Tax=Microscilla marina ATCC 23134 TaxID=313606 RepID=A1ZIM5_MICM2|nr:hypothetical protein [Microscilla marina]EAY29893.1 hypothetical protein M23134_05766 [Microscilla marina ATCC 23134]
MNKYTSQKIKSIIGQYATAYQAIEELQENSEAMPKGDQKAAAIGEYYAYRYCQRHYPKGSKVKFAEHSQKGWSLCVTEPGKTTTIQVKTVSGFSAKRKTNAITPKGWDQLFVVCLDKDFLPTGFWIFDKKQDFKDHIKSFTLTPPKYDKGAFMHGSDVFSGKSNDCNALRKSCGIPLIDSTSRYLRNLSKLGTDTTR